MVADCAGVTDAMDLERFARTSLATCQAQFPRNCSSCGHPYATFDGFLRRTTRVGHPLLDPIEDDEPIGVLCFANCPCGSTLALQYEDTREHVAFNKAIHDAARETGRSDVDILQDLVELVHRWAHEGVHPTAPPSTQHLDPLVVEIGGALLALLERDAIVIPPAPTAALKVRALASSDAANPRALADAIAFDPGLATGVLRAANSSFYQRGGEITSLTQAVTRLGFKEIANLALTLGVGRTFVGSGPFVAQRAQLWRRSLVTGFVARVLAGTRRLDPEECFGSGLFASLGSVVGLLGLEVLLQERGNLPAQPWSWWLRLIDLFAADLGAAIASRWSLPALVASVVRHPFSGAVPPPSHGDLVVTIHVAQAVAVRALERPRVEVDDLDDLVGLDDVERELVVNALPGVAAAIAVFDAGMTRPAVASTGGFADVSPPARPLAASTVVPSAGRYDVVGLAGESVVIEGPEAFAETTLVSLEIELEPRLRLWATTTRTAPSARGHKNQLAPFALDEPTYRRWRLLVADQAAERTRQTLRAMEALPGQRR